MPDLLPPVTQTFVADAAAYLAGIDEMIAANTRLDESITATAERMKTLRAESVGGAEAGAASGAGAAEADESATARTKLAAASRSATEAETALAEAERALAQATAAVEPEQLALVDTQGGITAGADAARTAQLGLFDTERLVTEAATAETAALKAQVDAAKAVVAAATEQANAERTAAEMAQLEKDMVASLAIEEGHLRDSSLAAADAQAKVATSAKLSSDAEEVASTKTAGVNSAAMGAVAGLGKLAVGGTAAAVIFAGIGVHAAADYQTQILRLKTSAGETGDMLGGQFTGNLKTVNDGILKLAVDTATSTKQLTSGMYMIESAGFHGAAGLNVLRAAAQGARAEGADLYTVGNALTTMMKDYHITASGAIPAMNAMIAVVAHGKTTMQDMAGALHSVLPIAASAHLSFAQVGGAIATMTSHGVTAQLATQHLANMIRNLISPNNVAADAMSHLGINSLDLSRHLGDLDKGGRGLTGTLDVLMNAILKNTKGGLVLENAFNTSAQAASTANTMMKAMPPSLQKVTQAYVDGKYSLAAWRTELKSLPTAQANLASQFASSVNKANGFTTSLKNNRGALSTVDGELKKMTGGAVGLETVLQLTGKNAIDFKNNVDAVGAASKKTGKNVENWSTIQHTFNFQMEKLHQEVDVAAIKIGQVLLPVLTKALEAVGKFGGPILAGAVKVLSQFWAGFTGSGKDTGSGFAAIGKQVRDVVNDLMKFGKDAATAFKIVAPVIAGVAKVFGTEFLIALRIAGALLANVVGPALVVLAKVLKACKPEVEVLAALIGAKLVASLIKLGVEMTVGKIKAFGSSIASTYRTIVGFPSAVAGKIDAFGQKMSTVGDAFSRAGSKIGEAAGKVGSAISTGAGKAAGGVKTLGSKLADLGKAGASGISTAAGKVADFGKAVGSATVSAAKMAAGWAVSAGKMLVTAAKWVGESIAKVAVVVATNVAGAVTTAAAWVAANAVMLLGIGLVVAIIAGIVILIIKYHKQIWEFIKKIWGDIWGFIKKIWNDIYKAVSEAVQDVIKFVKTHWMLILGILLGPIALAVALIATYWHQIYAFFSKIVSDIVGFVKEHWQLLLAIITGPIGIAVLLIKTYWGDIKKWFNDGVKYVEQAVSWFGKLPGMFMGWMNGAIKSISQGISTAINWFAGLPGRVTGALGNLAGLLVSDGKNVMIGLWNGIVSMGSWLYNQITSLIESVIPGPVKSILGIGSPSRLMHGFGQNVGQGLAAGITSQHDVVRTAMTNLVKIVSTTKIPVPTTPNGMQMLASGGMQMLASGALSGRLGALSGAGSANQSPVVVNHNYNIAGSVWSETELLNVIQKKSLQRNRRNPTNGLSILAGRG